MEGPQGQPGLAAFPTKPIQRVEKLALRILASRKGDDDLPDDDDDKKLHREDQPEQDEESTKPEVGATPHSTPLDCAHARSLCHTPSNHTRSQFVPRLDREKTLKSVEWLLLHYRGWFKDPEGACIAWRALCNSLPERVEDVHEPPMWDWPSKCKDYSQNLPPDLAASAKLFTETIEYRNVIIPQTLGKAQVEANQDTHRCGWASNTKAACY